MPRTLPAEFVARYARAPAKSTVETAISLHQNIRELLGDTSYRTFLQGSYMNDTALADMNDVDIVAVTLGAKSDFWSGYPWDAMFSAIGRKLDSDLRYKGKWSRKDKCIQLEMSVNIDIVPAVVAAKQDAGEDPITIYSFGSKRVRKNWPRQHHTNGAAKSKATNDAFKQTVRLFKRWAKCQFEAERVAPSYYLECLIASLPNNLFSGDLAEDFVALSADILTRYGGGFDASYELPRLGGEGDLFTDAEWDIDRFRRFRTRLAESEAYARSALAAAETLNAKARWRQAFAGHDA